MTIGIYCLQFEGTDKVYIGQSINIERRFKTHKYSMSHAGESAHKLRVAYLNYGMPKLIILVECNIHELDTLEQEAIDIYNSIDNGFNSKTSGNSPPVLFGDSNGSSTISNDLVEKVFYTLVYNPETRAEEIKHITGVSLSIIRGISSGKQHRWLEEKYPEDYKVLLSNATIRKQNNITATTKSRLVKDILHSIVSPEGKVYTVECFRQFARDHGLDRKCLAKVVRGTQKIHKGWKAWDQQEQK